MRTFTQRALSVIAATATTAAITAAPAAADPLTYTIQNGGYITGTNVGSIVGYGWQNGWTLECTDSTITGWTQKDTSGNPVVDGTVDGENIATLDNVSFSSPGETHDWCVVNGAFPTQMTPLGLPWKFDATGAGASSGPLGMTEGRLTGVQFKLHILGWMNCDAIIGGPGAGGSGGYYEATYTNPSSLTGYDGTLSMPFGGGNLKVLTTSDGNPDDGFDACQGWISVGEAVMLAGTYNVQRTSPVPPAAGISPTID